MSEPPLDPISPPFRGYCLLTGATGLVGRYLLRDLLIAGIPTAVLVRATKRESVEQRIAHLRVANSRIGDLFSKVPIFASPPAEMRVLEGDLCRPDCGLTDQAMAWVRDQVGAVLHSAASVSFRANAAGEPYLTNVTGTQNLLHLCQAAGIQHLYHVSTAYVCGDRQGVIQEEGLYEGQSFRNPYEESKWQAERLLRDSKGLKSLTVFRPPYIAGDSRTGFTSSFHGLFHYLKLMSLLNQRQAPGADGKRCVPVRLAFDGLQPRNCVPVDWVSSVIVRLMRSSSAQAKTFHLVSPHRITVKQVIEYASNYFQSTGVEFGVPIGDDVNEFEALTQWYLDAYQGYDDHDPEFDCANLLPFVHDLPCPVLDEPMLHRYIRFGEQHAWGRSV